MVTIGTAIKAEKDAEENDRDTAHKACVCRNLLIRTRIRIKGNIRITL